MTYEYICAACGHQWEASQSITAAPLKECPSCHNDSAKRQISGGTGFVLKGGGWYADLYGSPSAAKKTDSKEGGETQGGEAKGSEAKGSETKSDAKGASSASGSSKSEKADSGSSKSKKGGSSEGAAPAA